MRAAIVSHTYVEDQNRGKLQALARKGVHVAAFVPSVWQVNDECGGHHA